MRPIAEFKKSIPTDPFEKRSFDYDEFNPIIQSRMLYQKYACDQAATFECQRLLHYKTKEFQTKLRGGQLNDILEAYSQDVLKNAGQKVMVMLDIWLSNIKMQWPLSDATELQIYSLQ